MIDKIILISKDFKLKDKPKLLLTPAPIDLQTGKNEQQFLLYSENGREIIGRKLYHNSNNFSIDINGYGLRVLFNPSNYFTDNNLYLANNKQTKLVTDNLKLQISDLGLDCDLDNMQVSRLDLARNIQLEKPVNSYYQILQSLSMKRSIEKNINCESYTIGNKQKQCCLYDKILEMKKNKKFIENPKSNLLRSELRYLKKNQCSKIGIEKMKLLYEDDYYSELKARYQEEMKGLFSYSQKKIIDSELDILIELKENNKRNIITKYLSYLGIENLYLKYGNMQNFKKALESIGFERSYIYRVEKQIEDDLNTLNAIKNKKSEIMVLREELINKLITA